MDDQELIRAFNYHDLLCISEILCIALRHSSNDLDALDELYSDWLPDDVFEWIEGLAEYERLKLIQLIINTLIDEAEQSTNKSFQPALPL